MPKFLCQHTLPPKAFTREQVNQFAQAAQHDPVIKGYRSFLNLTDGKAVCVMEAPNKDALSSWFKKMKMPVDSITQVELEGDCGVIHDAAAAPAGARR